MTLRSFAYLADENIHPEVIAYLLRQGCDVVSTADIHLRGAPDQQLIKAALAAERVILTHIRPAFTISTLETLLESSLDLTPPFLLVAIHSDDVFRVRVRSLGPAGL